MFNLVTGDDSIFYLNGWRWLGLGGVTLKDRNVLVSTGLLPLTRCVDHPGSSTRLLLGSDQESLR